MGRKRVDWGSIRWGTLTKWLKKHESKIKRRYGESPFTRSGEINDRVLRKLYNDEEFLKRLSKSRWRSVWRKIHFKLHVLGG
ncbi:MAG: hypothetical protein QXT64_05355 [Desulfurococcaceae archaeon]